MPLQTYNDFIVDYRLRQFRTQPENFGVIEFIEFTSTRGDELLSEMLALNLVPEDNMHDLV